jgi:hypothetical protein
MTRRQSLGSMAAMLSLLLVGAWLLPGPAHSAARTAAKEPCCCEDATCPPGCTPECAAECLPTATAKPAAEERCCEEGCPLCWPASGKPAAKTGKADVRLPCPECPGQ